MVIIIMVIALGVSVVMHSTETGLQIVADTKSKKFNQTTHEIR
jgi:peroxiredoxin family protein